MISTNENLAGNALAEIEPLTKAFADRHAKLCGIMADLDGEQAALLKKFLPRIRAAVDALGAGMLVTILLDAWRIGVGAIAAPFAEYGGGG